MTDYVCLFKMFLRVYMAMYMFDYVWLCLAMYGYV